MHDAHLVLDFREFKLEGRRSGLDPVEIILTAWKEATGPVLRPTKEPFPELKDDGYETITLGLGKDREITGGVWQLQ